MKFLKFLKNKVVVGSIAGVSSFLFVVLMVFIGVGWDPTAIAVLMFILGLGFGVRWAYLNNKEKRAKKT